MWSLWLFPKVITLSGFHYTVPTLQKIFILLFDLNEQKIPWMCQIKWMRAKKYCKSFKFEILQILNWRQTGKKLSKKCWEFFVNLHLNSDPSKTICIIGERYKSWSMHLRSKKNTFFNFDFSVNEPTVKSC